MCILHFRAIPVYRWQELLLTLCFRLMHVIWALRVLYRSFCRNCSLSCSHIFARFRRKLRIDTYCGIIVWFVWLCDWVMGDSLIKAITWLPRSGWFLEWHVVTEVVLDVVSDYTSGSVWRIDRIVSLLDSVRWCSPIYAVDRVLTKGLELSLGLLSRLWIEMSPMIHIQINNCWKFELFWIEPNSNKT